MSENSRTIEELITMYTLESELIDFYVEGITDKLIIDNFITYKKSKLKAIEIDTLNFSDIDFEDLNFMSNKDKLILLSRILSKEQISSTVHCLTDKDFDGILKPVENNNHIIMTDYSCMESYFFCKKSIEKFIQFGIRDFPFSTEFIIEEIGKVLRCLFILRLVNLKFELNCPLLKIDGNLNIEKSNGKIGFDFDDYITKFLQKNNLNSKRKEILDYINNIQEKLDPDHRNTMNGHDFIEILYLYINKIKSSSGYKHQTFERSFLASSQPDHLDEYPLFKLITGIK